MLPAISVRRESRGMTGLEQDRLWSRWMAAAQDGDNAAYARLLREVLLRPTEQGTSSSDLRRDDGFGRHSTYLAVV